MKQVNSCRAVRIMLDLWSVPTEYFVILKRMQPGSESRDASLIRKEWESNVEVTRWTEGQTR